MKRGNKFVLNNFWYKIAGNCEDFVQNNYNAINYMISNYMIVIIENKIVFFIKNKNELQDILSIGRVFNICGASNLIV